MTTLTAPRRTIFHRPGIRLFVVCTLAVAAVLLAALTIPRLMSTSSVTRAAQTLSYPGVGNESQHQVRGLGTVRSEQVPPFSLTQTRVTTRIDASADQFWHGHGPLD